MPDKKTISEFLEKGDYQEIHKIIGNMNPVDITELLENLPIETMLYVFRLLPKDLSAEVFTNLDSDMRKYIINSITDTEMKSLVNKLFIDDTVDIIEELPAMVVKKILKNINPEKRALINRFLNYPEDSAGSIMTIEFMDLKKEMTVGDALHRIKRIGVDKETVDTCYVIDSNRILEGEIDLRTLILEDDDVKISDVMSSTQELIYVTTTMDVESVSCLFKKYDALSLPVVDNEKRLVGIITIDDILDVVQDETDEDIEIMSAILPMEEDYIKTGVFIMAGRRFVWLFVLMLTATITQTIIKSFDELLTAYVVLMAYVPMLMGTGGNAGGQSSTLIIRGLSTGEIKINDFFKIIWKEARVGLFVGVFLALANVIKMLVWDRPDNILIIVIVSLSLLFTVFIAKIFGGILPLVGKFVKIDPAVMSAPIITTIVDALTVLIYFSISMRLLQI